ncbi:hypothetical protein [Streptomyces sp. DH37]|uniref:hypothetical protein n=1 Tax=Streptomyces sp. DH37 TaxID=3040122 RepID=UPI0024420A28|nr:hypothetical protein [Streptomyces sp. DH37]MDG9701725.1 hypothetical protein [Streptomyces sp. DH37]
MSESTPLSPEREAAETLIKWAFNLATSSGMVDPAEFRATANGLAAQCEQYRAEVERLRAELEALASVEADRCAANERLERERDEARARVAELEQQAGAEAVPCVRPEPHPAHLHSGLRKGTAVHGRCPGVPADFFQPGRTYAYDANGFTAPELLTRFRVEHITVHPGTGKRMAFGWIQTAASEPWSPYAEPADEWPQCWTELVEDAEAGEPR